GKLGLLTAQVLQARGARVHLCGRRRHKVRIAEKKGVAGELRGSKLPKAAYDYVVEATGSPEGLPQAIGMVRPLGTVILKSTTHGSASLDTAPVVVNEVTLVGSRCGPFRPALDMLAAGRVNVADMISDSYSLGQAPAAFERAQQRGVLKVLLCDNGPAPGN